MSVTQTREMLREALLDAPESKKDAVLSKAFSRWFSGMVYNQIWEDPEVDAEALRMGPGVKMFTISSGGCNVLSYLTWGADRVTAVDLNTHHLQLANLKVQALKSVPSYSEFHSMFAEANAKSNKQVYLDHISKLLTSEERQYWEGKLTIPTPKIRSRIDYFSNNLYNYSRSGYFIRFLHSVCFMARCAPEKILGATSIEQQVELYEKYLDKAFDHFFVKFAGKLPFTVFSLGIPPHQFRFLSEAREDGIIGVFRERVRRLCCNFPIATNYFAWQGLARRYNTANQEALPRYLQQQYFEQLQDSVSRVRLHHASLTDVLKQQEDNSYNAFSFLDAQDWMSAEQLTELWTEVARVCEPGGRVVFRTAGKGSPLEEQLPEELLKKFTYHSQLSEDLHLKDRSAIYGGFYIYERRNDS